MARLTLLLMIVATILCGCSRDSETDCDRGLCGHKWALELDSALARAETSLRSNPEGFNALLGYADASLKKASFVYDQNKSREDFWLFANLKKVDVLADSASSACDRVLLRNKDAADAYRLKGKCYTLKARLSDRNVDGEEAYRLFRLAESCFEKAVALSPQSAEMWYALGMYYEGQWSAYSKSRECFEKALEYDPNHLLALAQLGQQYNPAGREYYAKARKLGSRDPDVLRLLQVAGSGYDKYNYLQSIRIVPNVAKVPIVVGIRMFLDSYDARRARYQRQIVKLEHHFVDDHFHLAQSSFQSGNVHEAMRHLKTWGDNTDGRFSQYPEWYNKASFALAATIYPTAPWIYIVWGAKGLVDPDLAIDLFNKAIKLDSSSAVPYYLIAETHAVKEEWTSARKWLEETFRRSTGDVFITVNAHLLSAYVHFRQRQFSQVIRDASYALRTDSAYAVSALFKGIYGVPSFSGNWFLLDNPIGSEFARSPSEKKIASLLNHAAGWSSSGRYLGISYPKCIQFFEKAIDQNPENLNAYLAVASVRSYFGEHEKGIEVIQKLLQRNPNNARAHRELGSLYWGASRLDEAKQEFERALHLGDSPAKARLEDLKGSRK